MTALSPTAARAVAAYGGEALWRRTTTVDFTVSAGGWGFRLKWRPPFRAAHATVRVWQPGTRLTPIDRAGNTGVLDGRDVRVEDRVGEVLDRRDDARRCFPYGRRLFYWDRLDLTYFFGYALWQYVALPALLLRDDVAWTELQPGLLEARFPPTLPVHCAVQRYRFDLDTGLLARLDYTAEVFGGWAKGAHVILAHDTWNGVPYTSRRRVTPVRADGRPRRWPVIIAGVVSDYRMSES